MGHTDPVHPALGAQNAEKSDSDAQLPNRVAWGGTGVFTFQPRADALGGGACSDGAISLIEGNDQRNASVNTATGRVDCRPTL